MPRRNLLAGLAMLLAVAGGVWLAWPSPITAVDQEQPRIDQAAPVPQNAAVLTQEVVAGHDGFSAVDLLAVVNANNPHSAVLSLQVRDSNGQVLAQRDFIDLVHNAPIRVSFPPQAHSGGQVYQLRLSGSANNNATVWAYDLNAYVPGALALAGQKQPGDLRFSTTYTYLWRSVLGDALTALVRLATFAVPLILVLWLPGALLLDVFRTGNDWLRLAGARLGVALGLSVTLLALAWLWAGAVGWHWSPASLVGVYLVLAALAVTRLVARIRMRHWAWPRPQSEYLALSVVLVASLILRLLAARDLAFPAWVDSSHHVLIERLLEAAGQVPANYQSTLPVGVFYYHFAFHALAVTLHWLTGQSLVDTTLFLGQILNGLMPLSVYCLAWGITGRRRAALAAAFVVGLVSFFPGYFVTWGRYTQLTGLLILGPAAGALWRALQRAPASHASPRVFSLALVGLLGAGVFLAHYRVAFFLAIFGMVAWLAHLRQPRAWLVLVSGALVALAASLPWVWRLVVLAILPILAAPAGLGVAESYNAFPFDYFRNSLERGWLALALVCGLWGLWRRERGVWALLAWSAGVFASLNAGPATWLINNNSWAISMFMPGSALLGWGADRWRHRARILLAARPPGPLRWRPKMGCALLAIGAGLAGYAGLAGARTQITLVNPATILATAADRDALDWLDAHLPPNAVVAVNGWNWLGGLWAGSDGGAWILPVTGRRTTLPPNDYAYGAPGYVSAIDEFNAQLAQPADAASPEFRALLAHAGVTHIYIGARGGALKPEMFFGSPYFQLLYSNGAAWVFSVVQP